MKKIFALSLLLLSFGIAHGMEECPCGFNKHPDHLNVKVVIPKSFEEVLKEDAEREFTIPIHDDHAQDTEATCILGIYANETKKTVAVKKDLGNIFYHESLNIFAKTSPNVRDEVTIALSRVVSAAFPVKYSQKSEWNKEIVMKVKMGSSVEKESFQAGMVEVHITPVRKEIPQREVAR